MMSIIYGDVYNNTNEVVGFGINGATVARLKEESNYITDYPSAEDRIDGAFIGFNDNVECIIKDEQPGIFGLVTNNSVSHSVGI